MALLRPYVAAHHRLLRIEIGKVARDNLQGLNCLRCVATFTLKTFDSPAQLSDAVLSVCDLAGNSDKSLAVTGHCAPSQSRWRQRVQSVCGSAKKVLCQSKDGGSRCNERKSVTG
jgi:hypothetical protein